MYRMYIPGTGEEIAKSWRRDFPGGTVVENLPANAGAWV